MSVSLHQPVMRRCLVAFIEYAISTGDHLSRPAGSVSAYFRPRPQQAKAAIVLKSTSCNRRTVKDNDTCITHRHRRWRPTALQFPLNPSSKGAKNWENQTGRFRKTTYMNACIVRLFWISMESISCDQFSLKRHRKTIKFQRYILWLISNFMLRDIFEKQFNNVICHLFD